MRTHFTRQRLLATTIISGTLLATAAPAFAQDAAPAQDDESTEVEEIVVTGSRIRRDPTNAPTPLIQVSREDLLTTGQNTVIDYLATVPALSNSFVPSDTTGTGLDDGGLSLPNLRSLGAGRTLTLVDGRRHVGSSGGSLAVDVDTIPRLLIENIEIITGGASSIYGADAVSGVLNFVLRRDFDGLEVDGNYGMVNQNGEANKRFSALAGVNLLDDRLNLYAFGEYEQLDEVRAEDIDWLAASYALVGVDADPTAAPSDGIIDARVLSNLRTMQRLPWGVVSLANNQPGSRLNDPDIPFNSCTGTLANRTNPNCTLLNPGLTWVFEGTTARLADFGERVGIGLQRTLNIGGDGIPASDYAQFTEFPQLEASRFQVGANFHVTDDIVARFEAKRTDENSIDVGQPTFFDIFINDTVAANRIPEILSSGAYNIRLSDNAFIPANLRNAILTNMMTVYNAPTANGDSTVLTTIAAPFARNALRGVDRAHETNRELTRYVASLEGTMDQLAFVRNIAWDIGYTWGQVDNDHRDTGTDVERMALASDAVVDTGGIVSGRPGQIVCRAQLLNAQNPAIGTIQDWYRGGDLRSSAAGRAAIAQCQPLNVFGQGNQSPEALAYMYAETFVTERNQQEDAIASISGQLWDFWGAGPLGVAVGVEHRREFTEAVGRDVSTAGRLLFLNTGPNFDGVEYETDEVFAEVSVPLIRDSWLGEYAELSGSYRSFDFTTIGKGDVYGVNLVYRPVHDIAFKSSFNTSLRAPNLGETYSPLSQDFANFSATDPCTTANINAAANAQFRTNRIANCTALAARQGLTFDFAGATPTNTDDFFPAYGTGGIAGSAGGNPLLQPEESESFTFSTVLRPRWVPNFSLVLDYYEIEITNVIAAVTAQVAADTCVNGPTLNEGACDTIFRRSPTIPFGIGAPASDPIGAFIRGSINYAKRTTRGLDFTGNYSVDLNERFGHDWGRLDYSVSGSWLLEQKQFNNPLNANDYVTQDGYILYPRVRLTSSLTYAPTDTLSINWSVDWQTAQANASKVRDYALSGNVDARVDQDIDTGNFARHDFTVRWQMRDDVAIRAGVVNAFDAEQARYLGSALTRNFDPYGTRFFIGFNYRPF